MKEFMLYIQNNGDAKAYLSPGEHLSFVKDCERYIDKLKTGAKLIAAQPVIRSGIILSKQLGNWRKFAIDPAKEVQVGYYHILANDMDEAIAIAMENPEFTYVPSATIEIRPIKTKEEQTDFVYPSNKNS